jgi:hypothetical protein
MTPSYLDEPGFRRAHAAPDRAVLVARDDDDRPLGYQHVEDHSAAQEAREVGLIR